MTTGPPGRRDDALRIVILSLEHPAPARPRLADVLNAVDPGRHIFDDTDDLLAHIHDVWFTCLRRRVEQVMFEDFDDAEQAVVLAWECTAHDLPAIRALLDAYRHESCLSAPTSAELRYLAHSAGHDAGESTTHEAGQRIVAAARAVTFGAQGETQAEAAA